MFSSPEALPTLAEIERSAGVAVRRDWSAKRAAGGAAGLARTVTSARCNAGFGERGTNMCSVITTGQSTRTSRLRTNHATPFPHGSGDTESQWLLRAPTGDTPQAGDPQERHAQGRHDHREDGRHRRHDDLDAAQDPVDQVQQLAERAMLVPVGAGLIARDNLVSTVAASRPSTARATAIERELKRYERRGATARNRFERQVRKTRTRFERDLRQRRKSVEKTVKQNRRQLEREVRSVRKDLEKQSAA